MIPRVEIEAKAAEFQIHVANVERDYVFGWLLQGIATHHHLARQLILKGGNAFRKAYFPTTRFSKDLDFSTEAAVDPDALRTALGEVCTLVEQRSGVHFHQGQTRVEHEPEIVAGRSVYDVRLYFDDFYGKPNECGISVTLDITEFDRPLLPIQERWLIHPYSDLDACRASIRCYKLEELLANKLKCLLQRRHIADLYDLAYAVLINHELDVNRAEVLSTFLRKTIFQPSPGAARGLLLELPWEALKVFWHEYIICPIVAVLDWDRAVAGFQRFIEELFPLQPSYAYAGGTGGYYPARFRNLILEAGATRRLLKITYQHRTRQIEPYSLVFKRRKDGVGQEYFYAYDQTGGSNPPGIKAFLHQNIQDLELTSASFVPRFPVDLARAGEYAGKSYFAGPFGTRGHRRTQRPRWRYIFECNYCDKRFVRLKHNTRLRDHQDAYGNQCYCRIGTYITREYY